MFFKFYSLPVTQMYSVIVSRREENIVPTALVTSELLHHGDRHLPRLKVPDLLCLANQRPEATVIMGWDCTMTDWWLILTLLVFHTPRIIKATWVHFLFVCSVLRIQGLTVSIASLVWLAFEWSSPGECDTVAWREAGGGECHYPVHTSLRHTRARPWPSSPENMMPWLPTSSRASVSQRSLARQRIIDGISR